MKKEHFVIRGYDAWGSPTEETISHWRVPVWRQWLRRIGYFFGIGRWKVINKITIRDR
jgi:hypothetical protein